MNSPSPMQSSELENKVLCYCYLVQRVMELGKGKKELEDIAHDQKDIEFPGVPVIDATAKSTENTLQDDGTMTRKVENGPAIKSAKSSDAIASIKQLQDINNRNKSSAMKKDESDKEI